MSVDFYLSLRGTGVPWQSRWATNQCHCEAQSAVAISVGHQPMSLRGTGVPRQSRWGCGKGFGGLFCFLSPPDQDCFRLERMLQPTQLRSQRQRSISSITLDWSGCSSLPNFARKDSRGYAEIASSLALLAKTVGVKVGRLPIDYSLCHNLDIGLIKVKASGGER